MRFNSHNPSLLPTTASQFDGVTEFDDEWLGDFETFVPGQGYLYYSASTETRTLVFITPARKK